MNLLKQRSDVFSIAAICFCLTAILHTAVAASDNHSYLLKISCSDNVLQIDDDILRTMINNPFVSGEFPFDIDVELAGQNEFYTLFELSIHSDDDIDYGDESNEVDSDAETMEEDKEKIELSPERSLEMIQHIRHNLQELLMREYHHTEERLNQLQNSIAEEAAEAERRIHSINEIERRLRERSGPFALSKEDAQQYIQDLHREKQKIEMQIMAVRTRQEAVEIQQRESRERAKNIIEKDMLRQKLLGAINDLKARVKRHGKQEEPHEEIVQALRNAEIEFYQREAELREIAGIEGMGEINNELAAGAIDMAEMKARLQYLDEIIHQIKNKDLMALIDEYELRVQLDMELARKQYIDSREQLLEINRLIKRTRPPEVTVIGADN